ncbi:hypothetical protein BUE80_DR011918, partial [Diplocarpon rosae]
LCRGVVYLGVSIRVYKGFWRQDLNTWFCLPGSKKVRTPRSRLHGSGDYPGRLESERSPDRHAIILIESFLGSSPICS